MRCQLIGAEHILNKLQDQCILHTQPVILVALPLHAGSRFRVLGSGLFVDQGVLQHASAVWGLGLWKRYRHHQQGSPFQVFWSLVLFMAQGCLGFEAIFVRASSGYRPGMPYVHEKRHYAVRSLTENAFAARGLLNEKSISILCILKD